jgi:hypothetical protein
MGQLAVQEVATAVYLGQKMEKFKLTFKLLEREMHYPQPQCKKLWDGSD